MKILLVTGRLAERVVREKVGEAKTIHEIEVAVLPVDVIALLTTRDIAVMLKRMNIAAGRYDLIIIPGLCRGSALEIYRKLGIPAVKGTIHADDIPIILELNNPLEYLSPEKPADEVLREVILERNRRILREVEESAVGKSIRVGKVLIPYRPPPLRIMAEIAYAHKLSYSDLLRKARYFVESGADILCLGFEPFNPRPDTVYEFVRTVKKELDVPVAVDTLIPSEISAAVKAGVDLVLSIDLCNVSKALDYLVGSETPFVLIPFDSCRNYLPPHVERLKLIDTLVHTVENNNAQNFIIDPILDPPIPGSLLNSLNLYREVSKRYVDKPLMMGVGNITELIDADSIGVNALLALLALEAGVSLLLTTEHSVKTTGSTNELKIATQMVTIAYAKRSPPKDLGIDLLVAKDKRRVSVVLEAEGAEVVELRDEGLEKFEPDPIGSFRIAVDHDSGVVKLLYVGVRGRKLIKGRSAKAIANYIISEGLVSRFSHAFYLGYELAKASEALVLGKNYVQDEPLFTKKLYIKT